MEHRVDFDVVDVSVAHLVKSDRCLLYFLLDGHAHVGVDARASSRSVVVVLAKLFVGGLNVVDRHFGLPNHVLLGLSCQSFESDLSTWLYFRQSFLLVGRY
jgi:hypothetical protein